MNRKLRRRRSFAVMAVFATGVVMMALAAGMVLWQSKPPVAREDADLVVYKRPTCSCCEEWVAHLRDNGLVVSVQSVSSTLPIQERLGVPQDLRACHTARAGDYWIEGHVPADIVKELITEQPQEVQGLAVPGMPVGSPGMEGPNPERYSVMRVNPQDEVSVYATRNGAESAE